MPLNLNQETQLAIVADCIREIVAADLDPFQADIRIQDQIRLDQWGLICLASENLRRAQDALQEVVKQNKEDRNRIESA